MSATTILIAATEPDIVAEGVAMAVMGRSDLRLAHGRVLRTHQVGAVLAALDPDQPCAIVLVGQSANCDSCSRRWLQDYASIVMVRVTLVDDMVHFGVRGVGLEALLSTACELAQRQGKLPRDRETRLLLRSGGSTARPLLAAALDWIHATLAAAVDQHPGDTGDIPGLSLTAATVRRLLASGPGAGPPAPAAEAGGADAALEAALGAADPAGEPLAALYDYLGLDLLEWKLLLLALAPECDARYQKCIGFLMENLASRTGGLSLFAGMLGEPCTVRRRLAAAGRLAQWRLFDSGATLPGPHEPLQLDPCIVDWIFGAADALMADARLRRVLQPSPWPGAALLRRAEEKALAQNLMARLDLQADAPNTRWLMLNGPNLPDWRALLELGARQAGLTPLRLELARLPAGDPLEAEETALRAARCARLCRCPLLLDAQANEGQSIGAEVQQALLAALKKTLPALAIIAPEPEAMFVALGEQDVELWERAEADAAARTAVAQAAADASLQLKLEFDAAAAIGLAFPLRVDGMARAGRLARARQRPGDTPEQLRHKLTEACRSTASQHLSRLAHRISPSFCLADVVLPPPARAQLDEIISNVRLAGKVLDEWRFGERLPYGRGVVVLFHGASGTGKTMAAQAIAQALGIDIFALDLSRVVSKYIGETERNIDAVFADAQRSGAAVLIDEADALLGKRSEVKDAHDRYANIEVAYLLQRMESFEGLAILTTNIRQNIDQAFVRRLRFVIEFPRPDARARVAIWRLCLPPDSHTLVDADFHLLARQADLTGGHIRQITLRAAFAAAVAGTRIGVAQLQQAMNAELNKLGLPSVGLRPMEQAA